MAAIQYELIEYGGETADERGKSQWPASVRICTSRAGAYRLLAELLNQVRDADMFGQEEISVYVLGDLSIVHDEEDEPVS